MSTTTGRAVGSRLAILAIVVSQLTVSGPRFASSENNPGPTSPVTPAAVPGGDTNLICQTCDPPDPDPSPKPSPTPTPAPPSFTTLMSHYSPYDINGDRLREINSLKPLFPNQQPYHSTARGVVIVLVNPRLVTDEPAIPTTRAHMMASLGTLGSDMFIDGYFPYFIEASVYDGTFHQDGRTLLALRRFLKEVGSYYPLAGVLLVGSFPDARIVRSVFVKPNAEADPDHPVDFTSGSEPVTGHVGPYLALAAEDITARGEIVLGDLDGNWEALYHQQPMSFTNYHALPLEPSSSYPRDGQIIETPHYQAEPPDTYEDVFYIQDHQVSAWTDGGWLHLSIKSLLEPSPEATAADRQRPNRIARPELLVSRIDPLRVAVMPMALTPDLDGKAGPLDAAGVPQRLRYAEKQNVLWLRDRNLERRLVADYIARSHSFRLGHDDALPFRTSAVRALDSGLISPGDFNGLLRRASDSFEASVSTDDATLYDYVEWLKRPAVLRGIAAHSDGARSVFGPVHQSGDVEYATGALSHVWRWVGRWDGPDWVLEPSFNGLSDANFHVHRTMWESGVLASTGQAFFVHDGCNVMRPAGAETSPYNHPSYGGSDIVSGDVANGESLMFYANGLGLMARNKVFYDVPAGFYEMIKSTGRFGYGWRAYFLTDANDTALDERAFTMVDTGSERRSRTLARKRSYFWNTIGDFTLKIRY
jgi:hypothetical protein